MSALNDIFHRLEQAYKKYQHLSPRDICLRTPAIERDSEILGVRQDLAQTQIDAEILLRAITNYALIEYIRSMGITKPLTSQYLQEVNFYCDKPGHKRSPIIAQGVFPQQDLDILKVSPRNLTHILYHKGPRQTALTNVLKKGKICCPTCKTSATKVKTAEVIAVYDPKKEEELEERIHSLKGVDRGRIREIMHPDFRFQTYMNIIGEIIPIATLLNQDPSKRKKPYPQVEELIKKFGAPLITAKSRMKFRRLITKYLLTKHIETDREFLDILGTRFIVPGKDQCYGFFYGNFQHLPFLKLGQIQSAVQDYIANPKPNGYQTLQALFSINPLIPLDQTDLPEGELNRFLSWLCLEAQVRTFEMEINANRDRYYNPQTRKKIIKAGLESKLVFMEKVAKPSKIAPHKIHH